MQPPEEIFTVIMGESIGGERMIGQRLTIDRELGARIRSARQERNLSEAALGALLGISCDQVARLESGETRVSSEQLTDVAAVLGKAVVFFFSSWAAPGTLDLLMNEAPPEAADASPRFGTRGSTRALRRSGQGFSLDRDADRGDGADRRVDYIQ